MLCWYMLLILFNFGKSYCSTLNVLLFRLLSYRYSRYSLNSKPSKKVTDTCIILNIQNHRDILV